jgi:hypothetical protein
MRGHACSFISDATPLPTERRADLQTTTIQIQVDLSFFTIGARQSSVPIAWLSGVNGSFVSISRREEASCFRIIWLNGLIGTWGDRRQNEGIVCIQVSASEAARKRGRYINPLFSSPSSKHHHHHQLPQPTNHEVHHTPLRPPRLAGLCPHHFPGNRHQRCDARPFVPRGLHMFSHSPANNPHPKGYKYMRLPSYDGPITDITSTYMACNGGPNPLVKNSTDVASVTAGSTITLQWAQTLDTDFDTGLIIDSSHLGPCKNHPPPPNPPKDAGRLKKKMKK